MNKQTIIVMDDEWLSSCIGKNPYLLLSAIVMNYCHGPMDKWNLDDQPLVSNYNPPENFQGMTNNVGLTFSVGDTILQFTINIKQENWNWWHYISYLG